MDSIPGNSDALLPDRLPLPRDSADPVHEKSLTERLKAHLPLFVGLLFITILGIGGYLELSRQNRELREQLKTHEEIITQLGTGELPVEKLPDGTFRKVIPYLLNLSRQSTTTDLTSSK